MTALARPAPRTRARPDPVSDRPKLSVLDSADERRRRRTVVIMVGSGGAVLALLLGVLYLQVVMLQRQRQMDGLASERTEVMRENQDLRRNVAELESPDAVVRRATDELGMVPAPEVLYLEPSNAIAPEVPLVRTLGDGAALSAATDPAGTDPAATDPAATDPAGTDPAATDAAATDPAGTDPAGTDPAGTDAAATDASDTTTSVESPVGSSPGVTDELGGGTG